MSGRMHQDRQADHQANLADFAPVKVAPPQSDPLAMLKQATASAAPPAVVFPKLMVGRADDAAERAADRAAEQALGGEVAHRSSAGVDRLGGLPVDAGTEARIQQVRSRGGRPLDEQVRSKLEPGFGVDLSDVRIHTGAEPDGLNRSLEAKAFTSGNDIFFRSDAYQPDSSDGLGLVAHEVAHVVQQGAGGGEVQRAFDPKDPDLSTITDVKIFTGGQSNRGVYMMTGEGGKQLIAKFMDEDPSGGQFADVVLGTAGVGSTGSFGYGIDGVKQVVEALRTFGESIADSNPGLAGDIADQTGVSIKAKGLLMMQRAAGVEADKVPSEAVDPSKMDKAEYDEHYRERAERAKKAGVNAASLFTNPEFHKNLGRLYVADAVLGLSDRFAYTADTHGKEFANLSNFMVTANGFINTIDNESVVLGYDVLGASKAAGKSAQDWAKFLIEGGDAWKGGLKSGGKFTQDLLRMFNKTARQAMFAELLGQVVKQSRKGIPDNVVSFDRFDTGFRDGILDGMTKLVGGVQTILAAAQQANAPKAGVDAEGLEVKMEFMKAILPTMQAGGEVDDAAAARGYAAARAKAEQIVARKEMENRAKVLMAFDTSLLPVPKRPEALGKKQKAKRKVGRLAQKIAGKNKDKRGRSANAKELRKGSGIMSLDQLEKAHGDIGAMTDGSHRQEAASFEVGLKHAAMKTRVKARAFEAAESDVHAIMKMIPDAKARQDHLAPYGRSERYHTVVTQYEQLLDGYGGQLSADESAEKKDIAGAKKEIQTAADEFEAELDYLRR